MELSFKHKKILEDLYSTKETIVISALKELRQSGDNSVIPYLIDLFVNSTSDKVKSETENFLIDLKDDKAAKPLSDALKDSRYKNKLEQLTSICWQADLDFSPYIDTFTEIAIIGDYQTSIEAYSVIEESLPNLSQQDIQKHISYLKEKITKLNEDKIPLIRELIISLENAL